MYKFCWCILPTITFTAFSFLIYYHIFFHNYELYGDIQHQIEGQYLCSDSTAKCYQKADGWERFKQSTSLSGNPYPNGESRTGSVVFHLHEDNPIFSEKTTSSVSAQLLFHFSFYLDIIQTVDSSKRSTQLACHLAGLRLQPTYLEYRYLCTQLKAS